MADEVRPVTEGSSSEIKEVFPYLRVRNGAAAPCFARWPTSFMASGRERC